MTPTTPYGNNPAYSNIHERLRPYSPDSHSCRTGPRSGQNNGRGTRSFVLDVVNNTDGSLYRRHGRQFSLSISHDTVTDDVLSRLIPDSRRYKVVVHWDDGMKETLDARVPFRELRRHADYLEVKKVKKVRFA